LVLLSRETQTKKTNVGITPKNKPQIIQNHLTRGCKEGVDVVAAVLEAAGDLGIVEVGFV